MLIYCCALGCTNRQEKKNIDLVLTCDHCDISYRGRQKYRYLILEYYVFQLIIIFSVYFKAVNITESDRIILLNTIVIDSEVIHLEGAQKKVIKKKMKTDLTREPLRQTSKLIQETDKLEKVLIYHFAEM